MEKDNKYRVLIASSGISGVIAALTAGITSKIKIKGFTGRGSITQVVKQINTKLHNGTIKHITMSTFGKMLTYQAAYSIFSTVGLGIMDAIQTFIDVHENTVGKIG